MLVGSGIGDGMNHDYLRLPIVLAGGALGMRHGRHPRFPEVTPLANLHLALLERFGVRRERFADGTGLLSLGA